MSKIAWITGAGKGIGRHLALQLEAQGWQVVTITRKIDAILKAIEDGMYTSSMKERILALEDHKAKKKVGATFAHRPILSS